MKIFTVFVGLSLCFGSANAQTILFSPEWEVGDKKTITYEYHETETKDSKEVLDTTYTKQSTIEVIENEKKKVEFNLVVQDETFDKFYEYLGDKNYNLPEPGTLKIHCVYNKKNSQIWIKNTKEIKKTWEARLDRFEEVIEAEADDVDQVSFVLLKTGLEMIMDNPTSITGSLTKYHSDLFMLYGRELTIGEPQSMISEEVNPFSESQEVPLTTEIRLVSVDESTGQANVQGKFEMDFSVFLELFKMFAVKMLEEMPDNEEKKEALEQVDGMTMTNMRVFRVGFNTKTNWVETISIRSTLEGTNPKNDTFEQNITDLTITVN